MNEKEYQEKYGEKASKFREKLAALCHEQWSGWMQYLFKFGMWIDESPTSQEFVMDGDKSERWIRQMETPYSELSEQEQQSDRKEADKFIELIYEYNRME